MREACGTLEAMTAAAAARAGPADAEPLALSAVPVLTKLSSNGPQASGRTAGVRVQGRVVGGLYRVFFSIASLVLRWF